MRRSICRSFARTIPPRPFRQGPESTGFERYYYSQFYDDGARDDDPLEAIFSEIGTDRPAGSRHRARQSRSDGHSGAAYHRLLQSDARSGPGVPRFFRAASWPFGAHLGAAPARRRGAAAVPNGFPDLMDKIQVTIDPQKSLEMMARALDDMAGCSPRSASKFCTTRPTRHFSPATIR